MNGEQIDKKTTQGVRKGKEEVCFKKTNMSKYQDCQR